MTTKSFFQLFKFPSSNSHSSGYEPIDRKPPLLTWTELTPGLLEEAPGDLHLFQCVEVNQHVFVIGGVSEEYPWSRGYEVVPVLSVCEEEKGGWRSQWYGWNFRKATGDIPTTRFGHTVTRVGQKIFLFGGRDPATDVALDDFYFLDIDIMRWRKIVPNAGGKGPSARYNHTCTYLENCLYIIGGIGNGQNPMEFFSDVHVFDLVGWKWEDNEANAESSSSARGGNLQYAIAGHIAIPHELQGSSEILVFGGSSQPVEFDNPRATHPNHTFNRFYKFKIATRTWEKVSFQIPANQPTTPEFLGESSSKFDSMIHHAATWRRTNRGLEVLIHGGLDDGGDNHGIRVLHVGDDGHFQWIFPQNRLYLAYNAPELRHHNMVLIGNDLYLLGGMKDLGKQVSPFLCLSLFPCFEVIDYTSIYKVTLPPAFV